VNDVADFLGKLSRKKKERRREKERERERERKRKRERKREQKSSLSTFEMGRRFIGVTISDLRTWTLHPANLPTDVIRKNRTWIEHRTKREDPTLLTSKRKAVARCTY